MITVKRGDTLALLVRRKNEDGTPRIGEASKLRAQVRTTKDVLVGLFLITETTVPGDYLFQIPATETVKWIPGTYLCDIEFKDVDFVQSSETFKIAVEKDVTYDA